MHGGLESGLTVSSAFSGWRARCTWASLVVANFDMDNVVTSGCGVVSVTEAFENPPNKPS